jgi:hypothetical protein
MTKCKYVGFTYPNSSSLCMYIQHIFTAVPGICSYIYCKCTLNSMLCVHISPKPLLDNLLLCLIYQQLCSIYLQLGLIYLQLDLIDIRNVNAWFPDSVNIWRLALLSGCVIKRFFIALLICECFCFSSFYPSLA